MSKLALLATLLFLGAHANAQTTYTQTKPAPCHASCRFSEPRDPFLRIF